MAAGSASAQNISFSTHDWTVGTPNQFEFREAWADVKMPGGFPTTQVSGFPSTIENRRTYVVGTVEVTLTTTGASFSGAPASPSATAFDTSGDNIRQVAMLQVNDAANAIVWQRYFYGETGEEDFTRATNARAVSVWRTDTDETTRIAICGETYDEVLPSSQAPAGFANATATNPSGYIAVFDGGGTLLWSHHFFADSEGEPQNCAITDVSIRVDSEGNDIVTYCGISSHGVPPQAGTELSPLAPFAAPSGCSGGATNQGTGQWDGIVGRLVRQPNSAATRLFHSIVGGPGQDGCFGIAELDEDRFAVAASSAMTESAAGDFPFTFQCGLSGPYALGALLLFDGSLATGNLVLLASRAIGTPGEGIHTLARDVHVGPLAANILNEGGAEPMIYVVGATDDPDMSSGGTGGSTTSGGISFVIPTPAPPEAQPTLNGPTDGFVAAFFPVLATSTTPPNLAPMTFTYHGGPGNDGLTGANGWGECSEFLSATGYTDRNSTASVQHDIDVVSYFLNTADGPTVPAAPHPQFTTPNGGFQLLRIRQTQIGGANDDRPTMMGFTNATQAASGLLFDSFGLGPNGFEAGGGIGVGPDGRCNVVGQTIVGGGYPTVGTGNRGPDLGFDAVRTELDLLPPSPGNAPGTARSDGTGFQNGPSTFPPVPSSGLTGGTTPFCALSQFGIQIGRPLPSLQRMLIDFEGTLQSGSTDAAIIVSRPTPDTTGAIAAGILEFGFPPTTPNLFPAPGVELWLGGGSFSVWPVAWAQNRPFRMKLAALSPTGSTVSVQLVCLLTNPVTGPGTGCSSTVTASPVLWFSF